MKKILWRILLLGLAGVAAFAAWRQWKLAHQSPVPEGIVFGNGRIESVQVDVAAKYGGRIKEILAREGLRPPVPPVPPPPTPAPGRPPVPAGR